MAAYRHHPQQQHLTGFVQNVTLEPASWIASAPELCSSADPELRAADTRSSSISTPASRISAFESRFGLQAANGASLSAVPNVSSLGLPVRNFTLGRLTAADDARFLYFGESLPTAATVPSLAALYTHFNMTNDPRSDMSTGRDSCTVDSDLSIHLRSQQTRRKPRILFTQSQ
ncbi:unnamed protein product, partial [Gongylonema pulchrum]|uniref:Uncharacterized protein n=1 Tax=Gongylonema pulchrum TaxID=637853 RepID=A0A183DFD4_9BILA